MGRVLGSMGAAKCERGTWHSSTQASSPPVTCQALPASKHEQCQLELRAPNLDLFHQISFWLAPFLEMPIRYQISPAWVLVISTSAPDVSLFCQKQVPYLPVLCCSSLCHHESTYNYNPHGTPVPGVFHFHSHSGSLCYLPSSTPGFHFQKD